MNFGTPVPLLLGIVLIIGAVALFFLDKIKPGYERDSDKVYAVLCLLSGIFLLGHLTMELIPSFQQIIMVGMLIALMVQNIRSRSPNSSRFAQQTSAGAQPSRDSYRRSRPSRSAYGDEGRMNVRAELEAEDYLDDRYSRPRPMLDGRSGGISPRPSYDSSSYAEQYPEDDRPAPQGQGGYSGSSYYGEDESDSSYGDSSRSDERIRRRRSSRPRNGSSNRYRLNPGDLSDSGYRPPRI